MKECNISQSRNGTNQSVEATRLLAPKKKEQALIGDGSGEKRSGSRGSIGGNQSGLRAKSKDNIGLCIRKYPCKVRNYSPRDNGYSGEVIKTGEARSPPEILDGPSSSLTFPYSQNTGTIKDENGYRLVGEKGRLNRGGCRTVLLIDAPQSIPEEDAYNVLISNENIPQSQASDIYEVRPEFLPRDCRKLQHCFKPYGFPKNHFQKPLQCVKCYQLELEERFLLEEMNLNCGEPQGHGCTHDNQTYYRDDRTHCCNVYEMRQCCQQCSRTPRHKVDDPRFCPLAPAHSDEKTQQTICKESSCGHMMEGSEVGHVPPFSKSDNPYGCSKLNCNSYRMTYSVRPVSGIPVVGKPSPANPGNWQGPNVACEVRPKSAALISEGAESCEKKYCIHCRQHPDPRRISYNEVSIPSEIGDCAAAYEGSDLLNNIQKPLTKNKIMKICNCPHLHMEENALKKLCIQQCVNKNETEMKSKEARMIYEDKETEVDNPEQTEGKMAAEKKETKVSVDAQKQLLTKSMTALLRNNKEDRRKAESLKSRLRLTETMKHSIGTGTNDSSVADRTGKHGRAKEDRTSEKRKDGNDSNRNNMLPKTNNIIQFETKNKADVTSLNSEREGSVRGKTEKPDGKVATLAGEPTVPESSAQDYRKNKCISLLKLYEDLMEFQREVDSGEAGSDAAGQDDRRRKLRYQLAHHVQELLKISDDGFHFN